MKLIAQMVFPVYNDGYGNRLGKIHPGFLTLQQTVRLPYNIWGTLTVGAFNGDRYGGDLKLFHPFKNEHFSIEARLGVTGTYYWDGFVPMAQNEGLLGASEGVFIGRNTIFRLH
jgi:hypothetical protein